MGTYIHGSSREELLANVQRNWQQQLRPGSVDLRVWRRLGPELIVDLLGGATFQARHGARALVAAMQQHSWRILDAGHGADNAPQFTLQVNGRKVELACKESPTLHIVDITT